MKGLQNIQPLVTYFTDKSFRSVVAFPYLSVEKQAKYWNVTLAIAKELYFYQYPFRFPNFFGKYLNKYDFEVKLEIITDIKTGNRIFVDHKGMIDFQSLGKRYIKVSKPCDCRISYGTRYS